MNLLLKENNIEVWDIDYLLSKFEYEIIQTEHHVFKTLLSRNIYDLDKSTERVFIDKLKNCTPGKNDWSKYHFALHYLHHCLKNLML